MWMNLLMGVLRLEAGYTSASTFTHMGNLHLSAVPFTMASPGGRSPSSLSLLATSRRGRPE